MGEAILPLLSKAKALLTKPICPSTNRNIKDIRLGEWKLRIEGNILVKQLTNFITFKSYNDENICSKYRSNKH